MVDVILHALGIGLGISLGLSRPRFRGVVSTAAAIQLSGTRTFPENTAVSTVLGTLSVTHGSGSYTYSITAGNGAGKFSISTANLVLAGALDYETTTSYTLTIRADNGVTPITRNFNITVTDIDEVAPTITNANSGTCAEDTVLAFALTADESVTWSIVGGADQTKFEISGSTLRWASNGTKDFDAPDDSDTNNTYVVTVRATDLALNTTDQTITITVTAVVAVNGIMDFSIATGDNTGLLVLLEDI